MFSTDKAQGIATHAVSSANGENVHLNVLMSQDLFGFVMIRMGLLVLLLLMLGVIRVLFM